MIVWFVAVLLAGRHQTRALLEVTQTGMQAQMDSLCMMPEGRTSPWCREPQPGLLDTTCSHQSSQILDPLNIPKHGTDGGHREEIREGMKSVALLRGSHPLSQEVRALVCGANWKIRLFPLALPSSSYHHSHQQLPLLSHRPVPTAVPTALPPTPHSFCPTPNCSTRNSLPKPAENKAGINPPPHTEWFIPPCITLTMKFILSSANIAPSMQHSPRLRKKGRQQPSLVNVKRPIYDITK